MEEDLWLCPIENRLGIDVRFQCWAFSVELVQRDGRLTGELRPPRFTGPCGQFVCKQAVLERVQRATRAPFTVAVGDGRNDVCMIEAADLGVGVEPCHPRVREAADLVVDTAKLHVFDMKTGDALR